MAVAFVIVACSGGGSVGAACTSNSQCSALSGGYCAAGGICTRPCSEHADCGCATGTTTGDIANGKCDVACITFQGATGSVCTPVCANDGDCQGATTCNQVTDNGVSAGYSICD
ncbi:MAG TPA: hypothetical protein VGH28_17540 [Polyangiaceae bacterium]